MTRALVLAALAACTPARADSSCIDDGKPFAADALRARLAVLADPALDGRAPGSDGDRAARAAIAQRFACLGLAPGGSAGGYEQPFDHSANLVGLVAGADPDVGSEIVVVGAHHDHLGHGFLGANDNASGVTALLAIAQAVRQHDPPRRTVAFVTFGEEEAGELGSQYFVAHPPLPLAHVVEYINLDMVGSYASEKIVAAMGTFEHLPARALIDPLRAATHLHVGVGGRAERSDHEAFCQLGIPYVFFWTPDDRCYHAKCDTLANVDLPHMAQIAELAGDLTRALADTKLDLAASRAELGCFGKRSRRSAAGE